MNLPIELWIYLAASAGACLGFLIATAIANGKQRNLYNRGWMAGRQFKEQQTREPRL